MRALASAFFEHLDATIKVLITSQYHTAPFGNSPRIHLDLLAEYIALIFEQSHQSRRVLFPLAVESLYYPMKK